MIDRWIIVDDVTHEVHPEGASSEKEAWKIQRELAEKQNRSPYEWSAHKVSIEL